MTERKSYNLFCFCMYYKSDFEFYGFKGLKLDFDKVWEFFHQKIEYFDTFVKADNIKKPENMQELTNLINYLTVMSVLSFIINIQILAIILEELWMAIYII